VDRNTFLAKAKLKVKDVEIPDMGTVKLRELSAAQVSHYAKQHKAGAEEIDLLTSLVIGSVIDDSGHPLFQDADAPHIREMPLHVLKAVADNAVELAGIADDSKKN
jgi:hypothetical protein